MASARTRGPEQWDEWIEWLSAGLHGRSSWRLGVLLAGVLLAPGRRTVSTWLRAAGVSVLYVRQRTLDSIPRRRGLRFRTRLELAVQLVQWAMLPLNAAGKKVWIAADGAYAKRPFLRAALREGVTVVSRLRKDAHLRTPIAAMPCDVSFSKTN